ncbi:MAG: riboflavin biosynthesis protein RibF [Opitutaceae bacterium]
MTPARHFSSVESAGAALARDRPLQLAIGMFDGVHIGHRAVIETALQSARQNGGIAAVLTFRPHPSRILRPQQPTRLIHDAATQAGLLDELGVDAVIVEPFTPGFAQIRAADFLPWLRERLPGLSVVCVGSNWRFGAGRSGDLPGLVEAARRTAVSVFSVPPVEFDGMPVNSTRIRNLLESGDVAQAGALLGYSYFARGPVIAGKGLGRTLGFPTLNLAWSPELTPQFGVYVVRVSGRGVRLPGVANYGVHPTVGAAPVPQVEAHVLGSCPLDAGDLVTVEWLESLRPEMRFSGIEALKSQIGNDVEKARSYFRQRGQS